jgi:hypothetical protein
MESEESSREDSRPFILRFIVSTLEERRRSRREGTNVTPSTDQNQILNLLINRSRETATTSNEDAEELTSLERRLRRRRFYYVDEQAESQDELANPREEEDYVDFRSYPLTINWKDIYSAESDSCNSQFILFR